MNFKKIFQNKEWSWRLLMRKEGGELSDPAKTVLADLNQFCHSQSVYSDNPLMMARLEGRREVYMRIMKFLYIDVSKQLPMEEYSDE